MDNAEGCQINGTKVIKIDGLHVKAPRTNMNEELSKKAKMSKQAFLDLLRTNCLGNAMCLTDIDGFQETADPIEQERTFWIDLNYKPPKYSNFESIDNDENQII